MISDDDRFLSNVTVYIALMDPTVKPFYQCIWVIDIMNGSPVSNCPSHYQYKMYGLEDALTFVQLASIQYQWRHRIVNWFYMFEDVWIEITSAFCFF